MIDRGVNYALQAWIDLLHRPQVWFAALGLALWGVILGASLGNYLPGAGADPAMFGLISALGNSFGFVLGLLCHFYMSVALGGEARAKTVFWKWIALELITAAVSGVVVFSIPIVLGQTGLSRMITMLFALPAAMLLLRAVLLPLEVRIVAAIHSGNRQDIGKVTRFLAADPGAWFGSSLLLGLGFAVVAFLANGAVGVIPGLPMAAGLALSRGIGGIIQATSFAFVITAYRTLDAGGGHDSEVFA